MTRKRWFKGNLHLHSFWSDGHGFPEVIADWFKANGYHFIAFAEHDQHQEGERWFRCDPAADQARSLAEDDLLGKYVQRFGRGWVGTRDAEGLTEVRLKPLYEYRHRLEEAGRFLVINGEEVTTTWGDGEQRHWINVFNTPAPIPAQHNDGSSSDAMRQTFDAGEAAAAESGREVLTYLNHPNFLWNATAEDIAAVPNLRHMEIHTALNSCNTYGDELHASAERIWDITLTLRLGEMGGDVIYGLATDDCHTYAPHHSMGLTALPGRAWIMVQTEWLTPDHIMAAVNQGRFYASTGVTLADVQADVDGIHVVIEPEPEVSYTTRFIGTRNGCDMASSPVVDAQGNELRTARQYGAEVGCVLAETTGTSATYDFDGDELYVRAVITSDVSHPNPTIPGDTKKAWTQPVLPD